MKKDNKSNLSIKRISIIVFIVAMLLSISIIGHIVFKNWFISARQTSESIAEDINESIYNQIYSFMNKPDYINEVNHKIIENGILDIHDEKLRDKFFVGILSSHMDKIYSFSYGTTKGEYFGARQNENGIIEIMRNDLSTGGNSWYYSVNEDMTAGDLVVKTDQFDPRTREWYKAAVKAKGPAFSPIYKHFIMDDLTVSAAWPIYNSIGELQGVLGSHMLLGDIGDYLASAVKKYNGHAFIFEKDSKKIIANSVGINNFEVLSDGTLDRRGIDEIDVFDFQGIYERYNENKDSHFLYKGKKQNLYINVKEMSLKGLEWVIVSTLPEETLATPVAQSFYTSVLLSLLALLLSFFIYNSIIERLTKPINNLLKVSDSLSSGDLTKRVEIVRNDEIGKISKSFNNVADKMQFLINNLETTVKERTEDLFAANLTLELNKNQLQLILDSTAEAIYGMDLYGKCTFCNNSCIKLLGYDSIDALIGKDMHLQIHHSRRDGTPFPIEECRIFQSIKEGKGIEVDDEVFWRADGTSFDVEYHSYPQIRKGEVVGGVVTFMDITERKQKEQEIQYLSCHDTLTGLFNRTYFEEYCQNIDIPENLPLSVIFVDINNLKMTNDIFGHSAGDELIKKSGEILQRSCRVKDMVARIGGDEFVILLPETNKEDTQKILSRIKAGFFNEKVVAIKCSVSIGVDTKIAVEQSLEEVLVNAENAMYKDKTVNRKSINSDMIDTIVEYLHSKSSREKQHSNVVGELCEEVGVSLNLSELEINKLKRAGYLHDIGKIILDENILAKEDLTKDEHERMRQHSIVGYRILNLFDHTLDLAEYVYSHHERWDGKGYPRGLKGEEIPLIARIISIVETYERELNKEEGSLNEKEGSLDERKRLAIEVIKEGVGKLFDPEIAKLFIQMKDESL